MGSVLHQQGGTTVIRLHHEAILKYGLISILQRLQLFRKCTNVRLPTVFDAWEDEEGNREMGFLFMEYIQDQTLAER